MRRLSITAFNIDNLIAMIAVLTLLFLQACDGDVNPRVVDFSHTFDIARPGEGDSNSPPLTVAVAAMISPKETFVSYRELLDYVADKLDRNVELVQRKTYGEINELLGKGFIDLAFICSGPYAAGKEDHGLELLATPEVEGSHFYHSYLIVGSDSMFQHLEDLRGRVFAFTDPDSHTGRLVPTYWLAEMREHPESFFSKIIYTYSHDNSILAVAQGLVDAAAVDSLVWEYFHHKDPRWTSKTRIIRKSEPYGNPPIVASKALPPEAVEQIRRLLLSMHEEREGRKILDALRIDRFVAAQDEWYATIREVRQKVSSSGLNSYAP